MRRKPRCGKKNEALEARGLALARAGANEQRAIVEAAKAQAISDLLQEMLTSANPDRVKGVNYTVRELLDDFSARLDGQLKEQPEVEATIRKAIGVAYRRLGLPNKAGPHLEAALELRRRTFGPLHERVAESLVDSAWYLPATGRYGEAEDRVREALAIYRAQASRHEPRIAALWALVCLQVYQGKHAQAEEAAREAMAMARGEPGLESPDIANILHTLADSKSDRGRFDEAEPLARESVALHRRLHGNSHPETGWGLHALARAELGRGRHAEAEKYFREALAIFRQHHGWEHKSMAQVLDGLMAVLRAKGDRAGIESLIREKLAGAISRVEREPHNPAAWSRRGSIHLELGQLNDAETAFREALRLAPNHAVHHDALGDVLLRQGRLLEAEAALRNGSCLEPEAGNIRARLGLVLWKQGRAEEAFNCLHKAVEVEPKSSWAWMALGWTRYRAGDWVGSIEVLERSRSLQPGGTGGPGQWIVLALAHWQLASQPDRCKHERSKHRDEARRWRDITYRQLDGIRDPAVAMPEMREFRKEAARLLDTTDHLQASKGISEPSGP
jgi:tetratricopeptide (TPR) repeat protein